VLKKLGIAILGLWAAIYFVLDWYGRLQTLRDLVGNRGQIVGVTTLIFTSQWFPLGLFLAAVAVATAIHFDLFHVKKEKKSGLLNLKNHSPPLLL
jgi:hypothetical protein